MKTLILTLEYPPQVGGIASYVENVARYLSPHQVLVYAPLHPGAEAVDAERPWETARRRPYWRWLWPRSARALWQVWRLTKKEPITVIQVHHILPLGYVAWCLYKWRQIPYDVFLHGSDWQIANQHWLRRLLFKKLARSARQVIVNSQFSWQGVAAMLGRQTNPVVIYPCPGEEFFTYRPEPNEMANLRAKLALSGKRVLISVSRLVDRKGHARLAELLPRIVAQVPNVSWLIIGDGPERRAISRVLEQRSVQSIVRFLPDLPTSVLPPYYHLADLFVLLTHRDRDKVEEAWGTSFIEAAASGLAAVAGRSGGTSEAVEHARTGVVVDVENDNLVIESIVELLRNDSWRQALGLAAKERALQEFRWSVQLKKLLYAPAN